MLPDTQFYSESFPSQFDAQTQWVADHITTDNLVFVTHVGDVVQNGGQGAGQNQLEWDRANIAMSILDGNLVVNPDGLIPYAVAPGNHDYDTVGTHGAATRFVEFFGASRYNGRSWYFGSSADQLNHYQVFNAGGFELLHITLEWEPRDTALAWAQGVIDTHPDLPVVLSTHAYLQPSGSRFTTPVTADGNSGEDIYQQLVRPNPQVFVVLNGHFPGEAHQISTNDFGQDVIEILADYQGRPNGGDGWMQLIEFLPNDNRIDVRTYSPTLDQFETDANSQFSIDINFVERFNFTLPPTPIVVDTFLQQAIADANNSLATSLNVDSDDPGGSGQDVQALVRFDSIFGGGAGQIPDGSQTVSASLDLQVSNPGSSIALHRMLQSWSDTDTWNSLSNGVQNDGVEAAITADVTTGSVTTGLLAVDVTNSLAAWSADPTANFGWVLLPTGPNGVDFNSSEGTTPPKLNVTFIPPSV